MSDNPQVNYRMLTPLIRFKINTSEKLHFPLNENLQIIINDKTIFPQWNNMNLGEGVAPQQILPGIAAMSFNYEPLLFATYPYVDNYPDAATKVLDFLLKGFGGVAKKIRSKPPKHLEVVCVQMVNFMGTMQLEHAGAQAFSSVDILLPPCGRCDS